MMKQNSHMNQHPQQSRLYHLATILTTFILSILSVQGADIKPTKITDFFCGWRGKCGPMSPCEQCYYTVGANMPVCCREKKDYGSACIATNCFKEDMSKCVHGSCGEIDIFQKPVVKPKPMPMPVEAYSARRRRLLDDDAEDQCEDAIEELCDSLGEDLCEELGIDEDRLCDHLDDDDDDDDDD
eukprot:TRINITY_DN1288_c0_g1_i2.p2 TRINITY_DN1288_c0_g1~~TRINITY_DN1288_c0_g1_i2.p2  ORF type:complete len:184 (-),score=28.63 TRINITY_DN1288_c0_g1_i2:268-819(-)